MPAVDASTKGRVIQVWGLSTCRKAGLRTGDLESGRTYGGRRVPRIRCLIAQSTWSKFLLKIFIGFSSSTGEQIQVGW